MVPMAVRIVLLGQVVVAGADEVVGQCFGQNSPPRGYAPVVREAAAGTEVGELERFNAATNPAPISAARPFHRAHPENRPSSTFAGTGDGYELH